MVNMNTKTLPCILFILFVFGCNSSQDEVVDERKQDLENAVSWLSEFPGGAEFDIKGFVLQLDCTLEQFEELKLVPPID